MSRPAPRRIRAVPAINVKEVLFSFLERPPAAKEPTPVAKSRGRICRPAVAGLSWLTICKRRGRRKTTAKKVKLDRRVVL